MSDEQIGVLTESVLDFGRGEYLSGVLTRFDAAGAASAAAIGSTASTAGGPGVLLLNAGVVSRSGPHRFNVKLARALARQGLPVLRFDVSGKGDSGTAADALPYPQQVTHDIVCAIEAMHSVVGIESVLIVGLCSGANQGWAAALVDSRIVGLVMIDSFAYPTRRTLLEYHRRRIRLRGACENLSRAARSVGYVGGYLLKVLSGAIKRDDVSPNEPALGDDTRLPLSEYAKGMQRLVDRGVSLFLVYTGSWSRHYSYPEQFSDRFGLYPFATQVQCEYLPQLDHTLTLVATQQATIRLIGSWIERVRHRRTRTDVTRQMPSMPARPSTPLVLGR
ncbi:MAG: alpha/beta fold hydrolase [Burkholderiaceae bacterium]